MAVLERTIQQRRARIACESLLAIAGGQSVLASNPNLNVTLPDYTVTVVVEGTGTISKGGWSISVNQSSLTHLAYTSTSIYANAQYLSPNSQMWDNTADLVIGAGLKVQHLKIANRIWTIEELKADRRQPGDAPDSTHESILAHYVADREGLVMWDVVEQYNYAKATPIAAYHATLQNFTPAQVDTAGGTSDAYRDFYDKSILKPYVDSDSDGTPDQPLIEEKSGLPPLRNALRFDASQNQFLSVPNFLPTSDDGYTIVCTCKLDTALPSSTMHFWNKQSNRTTGFVNPDGSVNMFHSNASGGPGFTTANTKVDYTNINQFVFTVKENPNSLGNPSKSIWVNDRLVAPSGATGGMVGFNELTGNFTIGYYTASGTQRYFDGYLSVWVAKGIATRSQIAELWNNSLLSNPKTSWKNLDWQLIPDFNSINDDGAGNYTLTDSSPQNHTINLSGFTAANLDPQDPAYALTEINSLR